MNYIYFIQESLGNAIKIGCSSNIKDRMSALRTSNPSKLKLLGAMTGDRDTEKRLHELFNYCRIQGEWFKPTTPLLQFIEKYNELNITNNQFGTTKENRTEEEIVNLRTEIMTPIITINTTANEILTFLRKVAAFFNPAQPLNLKMRYDNHVKKTRITFLSQDQESSFTKSFDPAYLKEKHEELLA